MSHSAAVLGATGQVGRNVLTSALASPAYSRVIEYGRSIAHIPDTTANLDKRVTHQIDFDHLDASDAVKDGNVDVVLIALGTTRKNAGSAEAFTKIDQDYPVAFAQAIHDPSSTQQRIVYCSAIASNASSPFLYPKSKGQTERRLSEIGFSETIIFQPNALLGTARPEKRIGEVGYVKVMTALSRMTDWAGIDVAVLGLAMVKAGALGIDGLKKADIGSEKSTGGESKAWYISNAQALKLAKLEA